MTYQIVTRTRADTADDAGGWSADGIGAENSFRTEASARRAIAGLRTLGADWRAARYGVRRVGSARVAEVPPFVRLRCRDAERILARVMAIAAAGRDDAATGELLALLALFGLPLGVKVEVL